MNKPIKALSILLVMIVAVMLLAVACGGAGGTTTTGSMTTAAVTTTTTVSTSASAPWSTPPEVTSGSNASDVTTLPNATSIQSAAPTSSK